MEPWPAESPDLNVIEPLWNQMKGYIHKKEPKTKEDLIKYAQQFWQELVTVDLCRRYVGHLQGQMRKVVANAGGPVN